MSAPINLTPGDQKILLAAWQSIEPTPRVNYTTLAEKMSYKNAATANAIFYSLKKKLGIETAAANNAGSGGGGVGKGSRPHRRKNAVAAAALNAATEDEAEDDEAEAGDAEEDNVRVAVTKKGARGKKLRDFGAEQTEETRVAVGVSKASAKKSISGKGKKRAAATVQGEDDATADQPDAENGSAEPPSKKSRGRPRKDASVKREIKSEDPGPGPDPELENPYGEDEDDVPGAPLRSSWKAINNSAQPAKKKRGRPTKAMGAAVKVKKEVGEDGERGSDGGQEGAAEGGEEDVAGGAEDVDEALLQDAKSFLGE